MKRSVLVLAIVGAVVVAVAGAALAQSISCPGGGACGGTARNDTMRGGTGDDRMVGGGGDDRMFGGSGQDMVKGKRDSDTIEGGEDDDKVKGGSGRDTVKGGPGDDIVRGGTHGKTNDGARDVLDCGGGTDTVYFVDGRDSVRNCELENPPE